MEILLCNKRALLIFNLPNSSSSVMTGVRDSLKLNFKMKSVSNFTISIELDFLYISFWCSLILHFVLRDSIQ